MSLRRSFARLREFAPRIILYAFVVCFCTGSSCEEREPVEIKPVDPMSVAGHLTVGQSASAMHFTMRVKPETASSGEWYMVLQVTNPHGFGAEYGGPGSSHPNQFEPNTEGDWYTYSLGWRAVDDGGVPTDAGYVLAGKVVHDRGGQSREYPFAVDNAPSTVIVRSNCQKQLQVYIGDWRYAGAGQWVQWYRSYPLYVKVYDADHAAQTQETLGVSGQQVVWEHSEGIEIDKDDVTKVCRFDSFDYQGGLAGCNVEMPQSIAERTVYTVSARLEGEVEGVDFHVIGLANADPDDDAVVGSPPANLLECIGYQQPSLGDGLWDDGDPNPGYKDLCVEVDYDWRQLGQNQTQARARLGQSLDLVADIFEQSGGLYLHFCIEGNRNDLDLDQDFDSMEEAVDTLESTRDFGGRGDRADRGCVHLIVGGKWRQWPSETGTTLQPTFAASRGGWAQAMSRGSTCLDDTGSNSSLNRCGCYALMRAFPSLQWQDEDSSRSGRFDYMSKQEYLALVIAHELGHALGLTHRLANDPREGVMTYAIDLSYDYDYYHQFTSPQWEEASQRWQINTRKVLGRDGCENKGNPHY